MRPTPGVELRVRAMSPSTCKFAWAGCSSVGISVHQHLIQAQGYYCAQAWKSCISYMPAFDDMPAPRQLCIICCLCYACSSPAVRARIHAMPVASQHMSLPTFHLARQCSSSAHLLAGQLAALSRLGALGDLDLQLVRIGEVVRRHAKAPAGNLWSETAMVGLLTSQAGCHVIVAVGLCSIAS